MKKKQGTRRRSGRLQRRWKIIDRKSEEDVGIVKIFIGVTMVVSTGMYILLEPWGWWLLFIMGGCGIMWSIYFLMKGMEKKTK